jgi:hypothetical protein
MKNNPCCILKPITLDLTFFEYPNWKIILAINQRIIIVDAINPFEIKNNKVNRGIYKIDASNVFT